MNILLIILMVHYVLFFKNKKNNKKKEILTCGIWAWSSKYKNTFSFDKFNILGFANQARGEDACGITVEGEIFISDTLTHKYSDFVRSRYNSIPQPSSIKVAIGHDRKASVGVKNADNTHPFGFGTNSRDKGMFKFIGVHNGTIYNEDELAKKYGVEEDEVTEDVNEITTVRTKIDSEILLEILSNVQDDDYSILENYNGGAALVWVNTEKPNTIFAFHGASRRYDTVTATETEERPLFYYQETKNTVYISSIEDSLFLIGGTKETVKDFDTNIVYEIKNGDVSNAKKIHISRKKQIQIKRVSYPVVYRNDYKKNNNVFKKRIKDDLPFNIHKEKNNTTTDVITFNKLRYLRNGHLITGIYTYRAEFDFMRLGSTSEEALDFINKNRGKTYDYEFDYFIPPFSSSDTDWTAIYDDDFMRNYQAKEILLFPANKGVFNFPILWIYRGILLKTQKDYETALSLQAKNGYLEYSYLSEASVYPVAPFKANFNHNNQQIIQDGRRVKKAIFNPIGSKVEYVIKKGNVVSTTDLLYKNNVTKDFITPINIVKNTEMVKTNLKVIKNVKKYSSATVITNERGLRKEKNI